MRAPCIDNPIQPNSGPAFRHAHAGLTEIEHPRVLLVLEELVDRALAALRLEVWLALLETASVKMCESLDLGDARIDRETAGRVTDKQDTWEGNRESAKGRHTRHGMHAPAAETGSPVARKEKRGRERERSRGNGND